MRISSVVCRGEATRALRLAHSRNCRISPRGRCRNQATVREPPWCMKNSTSATMPSANSTGWTMAPPAMAMISRMIPRIRSTGVSFVEMRRGWNPCTPITLPRSSSWVRRPQISREFPPERPHVLRDACQDRAHVVEDHLHQIGRPRVRPEREPRDGGEQLLLGHRGRAPAPRRDRGEGHRLAVRAQRAEAVDVAEHLLYLGVRLVYLEAR